ncbi:ABC transporter permease [Halalkalibacter lacteus]|uniref:ABC transporter permease n=1 Tax=Halalkalibacter lacteus TaxID=3090663 RepID=UPI002FC99B5F
MRNLIILEWRKLKRPILLTIIVGTLLSIILCSTIYKSYALEHQLEVWEVGFGIINFIFPLIAVLPTCWLMYFERKNGFLKYTLPRASKKQYLVSKWIVISGSSFLIMFIISFAGVVTALYGVQPIDVTYTWVSPQTGEVAPRLLQTHFAGELFTKSPLLYGLLLSVWKGFICVIVATMGYVFSLYSQNLFVILTGPFVYVILENFILSILHLERLRLVTAFEPTNISVEAINPASFIIGPMLAIVIIILYVVYMKFKVKESIYTM